MTTKLRMKNTSEDIEIILKQERKQRKKRRKEESRTRINDSITPPRIPSTSSYTFDHSNQDIGFDESTLPPFQSRKPENYNTTSSSSENNNNRNQQNNNNRNFNEKLRDAMEEDEGIGYQEELLYSREASRTAASFSYGGAASIAMGFSSRNNATLNGLEMDEEEYAEMVRAGMWRLKNKDEAERRDAALKAFKEREVKEKLETEQRKKEERERIKKLEDKVKKRAAKDDIDARKRYEDLWKKILTIPVVKVPSEVPPPPPPSLDEEPIEGPIPLPPPLNPLRFTDFPWPLYPPVPFPPLSWPSTNDITATAISTFLLSHVSSKDKKSTLRTAVLAYHPDRFDRLLSRIPEDKIEVKERVKELGLRVSQVLNDLLKASGN